MKFSGTDKLRSAAIFYKNNGRYCNYPKGSVPYNDYWQEEDFKCRHGITAGGITITGPHYFYLNYVQINSKNEETGRKSSNFPRFLDIDYDYFQIVDKARKEQKGVILVKPRRTGFSYKNAALVTHEYNFYRDSSCIIGANLSTLSENTMGMVLNNLNFLDTNTEWVKPRNPDKKDHVKAQHLVDVGGVKVWKGFKSSILSLTFKDNPTAAVGKSASLFIFEEAGTFSNLMESYNMSEPCWKDGEDMTGIPIIFGTGGSVEQGTRDFQEMFYNPEKYNLLAFDNVWDEGKEHTRCGWFIPATRGRLGGIRIKDKGREINTLPLVDADGNSDEELAKQSILSIRETKSSGLDSKALRDFITQFPLSTKDSFLRTSGNIFPVLELQEHLGNIETSKELQSKASVGELYFDAENKLTWRNNPELKAITDFPLKSTDSKEGAITIWEFPDAEGVQNPYGLYLAGNDPIDQDSAHTSNSLGSFFVYKTFYRADKTYNQIVAEYTGRTERADDFYENCRRLCIYYNAKCLYENQLKGLKNYFMEKNSLQYLYEQPSNMIKDIVKDSHVNRGYGVHMSKEIKQQCEIYLKQWLLESRADINGKTILNLHTILSIPLLKELIAYDGEINTDRVVAFMLCILQSKEMYKVIEANSKESSSTYNDAFFKKSYFKRKTNTYF